ncbi:MAG: NAD+ synthase [bacterium]
MSLRCALVQLDTVVGALTPNAEKIARLAREARADGANVIVFPELALSGYPPEDLVLKRHFVDDCRKALDRLAGELPEDTLTIVGAPWSDGGPAFNTAVVFKGRERAFVYRKMLLPNYGVFDEQRVFAPGSEPGIVEFQGVKIGLHICEDSWFTDRGSCAAMRGGTVDVVINISASPYHRGKLSQREDMLRHAAQFLNCPLLYCNLVGGQDELVFDGASMALDADGTLISRARQFDEETLYVRVKTTGRAGARPSGDFQGLEISTEQSPTLETRAPETSKDWRNDVAAALEDPAEVYGALRLGLRDYVDKNGFTHVLIGLSGGIDSALVATLAVDALGPERVVGVTMPSQFTSGETLTDAQVLAHNLGIQLHTVPIRKIHELYLQELAHLWAGRFPDATEENLQARIRGNIVMALSNKFGWLVLTTGNKSEMATGYCTLYGDMAGGFAVIKDVPKTLVWDLARWRNSHGRHAPIPVSTIERPPTAELKPDQKDTDSLPPYEVLDRILERYVERDLGAQQIVGDGFDAATVKRVIRMVDRNEYKRRQGAPGVKITPKAFGRDRRLPITNLYGERVT